MEKRYPDLDPPYRLLMGPGPSNAEPRVLRAMATSLLGQFDPRFTDVMNDVVELGRYVFQTANERSFPVSGSARAGLEAVMTSVLEQGDRVVVGNIGRFGELLADLARRAGADVLEVAAEWGRVIEPDQIKQALEQHHPKLLAVVHGETSTGMRQPLEGLGRLAHDFGAIFMVDAVPSLGGVDVAVDRWEIDVCVTGMQKCLGGPPGMAPLTYNERVERAMNERTTRISSNYLDLTQIAEYWGPQRYNHHTAPTSQVYALRETLRIIYEEGLEARFARHERVSQALRAGLEEMGLGLFGDRSHALAMITPALIPDGINDRQVRAFLLEQFNVEIGMAFGPLLGKVWRIGTMGHNAQLPNVLHLLAGLEQALAVQGYRIPAGAGVARALEVGQMLGVGAA